MEFNDKQISLLIQLLMCRGAFISSENLGILTGLSTKTVREELRQMISALYDNYGIRIILKKGEGYSIPEISPEQYKPIIVLCSFGHSTIYPFANNEFSIHYMIQRLITSEGSIKIADFMDELYVSSYTVNKNLKIVREVLSVYHLRVIKESNKGIIVKGYEQNKRICILNECPYFDMMKKSIYCCESFRNSIETEETAKFVLREIVQRILYEDGHYTMPVKGIEKIITALILVINRIRQGCHVDYRFFLHNKIEIKGTYSYSVVGRILKEVGEAFQITFNEEERAFMSVIQLGFRDIMSYEEVFVKDYFEEGYSMAEDILNHITEVLDIVGLARNKNLRERMALHLISGLTRIRNNLIIDYIPFYLTHNGSFLATELAVLATGVIKEKLDCTINSNEIDYLAFHFDNALQKIPLSVKKHSRIAIVTIVGRNIGLTLTEKMLSAYPGFSYEITALEAFQSDQITDEAFDLVITDLPREQFAHLKIPVIWHEWAFYNDGNPEFDRYYYNKYEMLAQFRQMACKDLFYTGLEGTRSQEILKSLAKRLTDTLGTPASLEKDLLDRDAVCTCERSNNMAMLMLQNSYTEESFLSVAVLNSSRVWFRKSVQIVIVFGLGRIRKTEALECVRSFEKIIMDYRFIMHLLKHPTHENFIEIAAEYYLNGKQ